jgi:hypothetical protein
MLFLGGGRYSLKRDPVSTACLLLSVIPRFPLKTGDQQYHLQALRHMYALGVEERVLHTIDVRSGLPVSADLELVLHNGERQILRAPGLLPELVTLRSVRLSQSTSSLHYWPCELQLNTALGKLPQAFFVQRIKNSLPTNAKDNDPNDDSFLSKLLTGVLHSFFLVDDKHSDRNELEITFSQTIMTNDMLRNPLLSALQSFEGVIHS